MPWAVVGSRRMSDPPSDKYEPSAYSPQEYEIKCSAEGCTEGPEKGEVEASMENRGWRSRVDDEGKHWYCRAHADQA
jgi:hypothetical protein